MHRTQQLMKMMRETKVLYC